MNFKKVLVGTLATTMAFGMSVVANASGVATTPAGDETELLGMDKFGLDDNHADFDMKYPNSWFNGPCVTISGVTADMLADDHVYIKAVFSDLGTIGTNDGDVTIEDVAAWGFDGYSWAPVMNMYNNWDGDSQYSVGLCFTEDATTAKAVAYVPISEFKLASWGEAIQCNSQAAFTSFTLDSLTVVKFCEHTNAAADATTAVAATCTEAGKEADVVCPDCEKVVTVGAKIEALGHDMDKATCEKAATCKRTGCGYTEGAALGHSYDDGVATTPATCEKDGVMTYTCKNDATHTKTEPIKALGHNFGKDNDEVLCLNGCGVKNPNFCNHKAGSTLDKDSVIAATCTGKGYTGNMICDDCHAVTKAGEVVDALGHKLVDIAAVDATCAKDGATAGKKCEVCGDITVAPEVVKATGKHTYKDGKCEVCGAADPSVKPAEPETKPEETKPEETKPETKPEEKPSTNAGDVAPVAMLSVLAMLGLAVSFKARKRA